MIGLSHETSLVSIQVRDLPNILRTSSICSNLWWVLSSSLVSYDPPNISFSIFASTFVPSQQSILIIVGICLFLQCQLKEMVET